MAAEPKAMTESLFIAGDWGTTNLRLYLCQHKSSQSLNILATQTGPGVAQVEGDFEQIFFDLAGHWFEEYGISLAVTWPWLVFTTSCLPADAVAQGASA